MEWCQRIRRGGFASSNWLRVEFASENWGADVEAARSAGADAVEGCHPVSNPVSDQPEEPQEKEPRTRCGARAERQHGALEVTTRTLLTQEHYDSKMRYAKTTRKIKILMQSLSAGTRVGYKRSWGHWLSFCRGQNQPVRLDSREESWDENLMNFILSEHDVLGLRDSTIRGNFSGIRAFRIISGKNDFATVGARWKLLIKGLARSSKNANRRLPYNAELVDFSRVRLCIDKSETGENSIGRGQTH